MQILALVFRSLANPVYALISLYIKICFVAIIFSWLRVAGILNGSGNLLRMIDEALEKLTKWYFDIFRRFIPPAGMVDVSSLFAIAALWFLRDFVPRFLFQLSMYLE